ncbi:MAG TPA: bifunctional riboflavin kinase/FAD synthetase [Streptosporangiaceae bacterium]|nr:bifunctional riboflavin kinase/FAD synthetase [Streptosporangiaceae bacterium]
MERWMGLGEVPETWASSVVTIGVFDGVHLGHQRIVTRAAAVARELGLPLVVVTFDPHPAEVIRPGSHPKLLCSLRRRAQLLGELGAAAVCVLEFTPEFSRLGPDEFVRAVLADRLHARRIVVGENFRFGYRAAGDLALLAELGEKYDFRAEGVPLLGQDGVTMSSSAIRDRLAAGDVAGAARGLGRPHRVEGVVVRGHQRGRALGFPTANLETAEHTAIPADGVYAGWLASLDAGGQETGRGRERGAPGAGEAERWPAAISVGTNPTFDGQHRVVEAYALDRDDLDLYGVHVAVDFAARLRGMARFGSVDELIAQMGLDVDEARALLGAVG